MHRRALFFLLAFILPVAALARGGGHSSHSGGPVHVHSYYRHDGTYVHGYDRAAPGQGTGSHRASEAASRVNLDTCLTGKRAPSCNYSLLTPEELKQVQSAERIANFDACLQGGVSKGCNRALLTPEELAQVNIIWGQTGTATSGTSSNSSRSSSVPSGAAPHATGSGYINVDGEWVPSPIWTKDGKPPAGSSAKCRDGSFSFSHHRRGTCSYHGGVARWL
jgi:hypothetical protein